MMHLSNRLYLFLDLYGIILSEMNVFKALEIHMGLTVGISKRICREWSPLTATNTILKCFHIGILSYNFCNRCIYDR